MTTPPKPAPARLVLFVARPSFAKAEQLYPEGTLAKARLTPPPPAK